MNKLYLNEYVISYRKIENILNILCMNNKCIRKEVIGKTAFGYNITEYEIGDGKNHVLLIGATHGLEIITSYFLLEFLITILNYKKIHNKYTFHFIPVLNPEGYIISSCNVLQNIKSLSNYEFEILSKKYMDTYNYCDNLAEIGKK